MADRLVFVRCQAFKGIQFGGERRGDVGWCEGEVGAEQDVAGFGAPAACFSTSLTPMSAFIFVTSAKYQ
jgi:hypothetical protein